MTEQTNAELIAEANRALAENQWTSGWGVESLAHRLVDALEAVVQERDNWKMSAEEAERAEKRAEERADAAREEVGYEKRMREFISGERDRFIDLKRAADQRTVQAEAELRDAFRTDIPSLKDQRDALAAVVEKVREEATAAQRDADLGQWADDLLAIITTAPADALREHDAKVRALANQERDQIAAVIEQAEDYVTRHYLDTRFGDEVLPVLATAPADALRELKADVWDEGHHAGLRQADYEYGAAGFQVVKPNPYRAREERGR